MSVFFHKYWYCCTAVIALLTIQAFTVLGLEKVNSVAVNKQLSPIPSSLGESYEKAFPYYLKYCSTTKYHPFKSQGIEGGIAGHAVLYLKGVCKDSTQSPSGLKMCPQSMDFTNPNTGVGISTDKGLKHVNFIVVPTLRAFITGKIYNHEIFDNQVKERLIQDTLEASVFDKIHFHNKMLPKHLPLKDEPEYLANYTFGSDYAIAMARRLYCINIPVIKPIMELVIKDFNNLNNSYKKSAGSSYRGLLCGNKKKDNLYHWNGIYDNCTHTIVNSLAKIGQLPEKKINRNLFKQIFHIAIPADTFLSIHNEANLEDISVDKYYKDPIKRKIFEEYSWTFQQEGILSELIEMYKPNHIYQENDGMFVTPSIFKSHGKKIRSIIRDPRFTYQSDSGRGFKDNLIFYNQKINKALKLIEKKIGSRKYKKQLRRSIRYSNKKQQEHLKQPSKKEVKAHQYIRFVEKFKKYLSMKKEIIENSIHESANK